MNRSISLLRASKRQISSKKPRIGAAQFQRYSSYQIDKKYYIWGSCDQGQLGLGLEYDVRPGPTLHAELTALKPKFVSIGLSHSLAVGVNDKLYAWGANAEYQLGDGTTTERSEIAETSRLPGKGAQVMQLIAGPHQSFAIVKKGLLKDVIGWGLIEENQAEDVDPKHFPEPKSYEPLLYYANEIEKLVLLPSYAHYALLTSGDVLHFGARLDPEFPGFDRTPGYCGFKSCLAPGEKIVDLVGGWGHVLALTDAGRVISWGSNNHGQTGHGEDSGKYVARAKTLPQFDGEKVKVKQIIAGSTHSMAITTKGQIFIWGSHRDGKLGLGFSIDKDVKSPVEIPALRSHRIKVAAAGCDHSIVLTEDNQLYSWGFGQHGALGLGNLVDQFEPKPVQLPTSSQIEDLYCGMDLTVVSTY